jgi:hypothetical protein
VKKTNFRYIYLNESNTLMDNEKNFKDSLKTETNLYNVSVCHLPLCSIREEISSRNCKYYQFLFQFIGLCHIAFRRADKNIVTENVL